MTTPSQPKYPAVCFLLLAGTLLLGGLFTLGGFLALYFYFPDPATKGVALILAANGLTSCALAILCAVSAWRLFKELAGTRPFARITCLLAAVFTVWILSFDGFQGWSAGGVIEVVVWGALEMVIGIYLLRTKGRA